MAQAGKQELSRRDSRSHQQLIFEIAGRAERKMGGTGAVLGTRKHRYAMVLLDRYQRLYGDKGLRAERSYLFHREVPYGTLGSARIDVYDATTNIAYDYKFGQRRISRWQKQKIQTHGPRGVSVMEVKP